MTKKQLINLLDFHGLSQVQLSRLLRITPKAVNYWINGSRKVPSYVDAYFRLFGALDDGAKFRELKRAKP